MQPRRRKHQKKTEEKNEEKNFCVCFFLCDGMSESTEAKLKAEEEEGSLFGAQAQNAIRTGLNQTQDPLQFIGDFQRRHFLKPQIGLSCSLVVPRRSRHSMRVL